ncbi:TIGR02587 family membrane protein [Aureimonas glaciei]|uniref:Membrane protein n=1 Tax=Aureimonas glaciei TaxID=1776957 RepID=A0A917DH60_9HYPH|nr:TIGR02587 family membrane protein [Aureimonas glaciei]GGD38172.1 membrane protein [Aureimonas glaciei]
MAIAETDALDVDADRDDVEFLLGLARAFGGAILFALPMFMTMEMWEIGASIDAGRFLAFLVMGLLVMILLAYYSGFEEADGPLDALLDGIVAFGVGMVTSIAILWVLGILKAGSSFSDVVGMAAVQAVPAGMGAVLARKQLGAGDQAGATRKGYAAELFLMLAGALFMALNVAPTEEMLLIAVSMTPGRTMGLMALSVILLHLFVYTVGFAGQEERAEGVGFWRTFLHFTVAGYGLVLVASCYVLWTFGSLDGGSLSLAATTSVVLGFPAALGAGIARLVV